MSYLVSLDGGLLLLLLLPQGVILFLKLLQLLLADLLGKQGSNAILSCSGPVETVSIGVQVCVFLHLWGKMFV